MRFRAGRTRRSRSTNSIIVAIVDVVENVAALAVGQASRAPGSDAADRKGGITSRIGHLSTANAVGVVTTFTVRGTACP